MISNRAERQAPASSPKVRSTPAPAPVLSIEEQIERVDDAGDAVRAIELMDELQAIHERQQERRRECATLPALSLPVQLVRALLHSRPQYRNSCEAVGIDLEAVR